MPSGKIVIYTSRITQMKDFASIIQARDNRNVEMIWSRNNEKHPMTPRQHEIWNSVLQHATIPHDIDILIYNASCLTGVNIKSPVDYVIVHDYDPDNQIQARGRVRNDIKGLYVPSVPIKKGVYPEGSYIALPEGFTNRPLYKDDKEKLAELVNLRIDGHQKKFPTISKYIKQSPDYYFEPTKNGGDTHRTRKDGKDLTFHIIKHKPANI